MRDRTRNVLAVVVASSTMASGCGDAAPSTASPPPRPVVRDAMIGATPAGFNAALYLSIEQGAGDDTLIGISTPLAGRVTMMRAAAPMSGTATVSGFPIELPAGASITFTPGGDHLMLEALDSDLAAGDVVEVRLDFERHDDVVVDAEVVPPAELLDRLTSPGTNPR